MTKEMMLDLIRRIKDDIEMQSEEADFKLEDIENLAEHEYINMTRVRKEVKQ